MNEFDIVREIKIIFIFEMNELKFDENIKIF